MSIYFAFLISLSTKVYRVWHTESLRPTCLKILLVSVDLPIYSVSILENNFLRWSSRYSGWFQNKPHAQKIRTSANFTFQYSGSILQHCVLCITVPLASCLWLLLYIFSLRWKHNQVTEVCTAENVVTFIFYGLPCQHTLIRKHPATRFYPVQPNCRTLI